MNKDLIPSGGAPRKLCFRGWRRAGMLALVAGMTCPAIAQPIELVTVPDSPSSPAAGGGGDSVAPILSTDGRYVLFSSTANNLALRSGTTPFRAANPPRLNVYLRDSSKTALVSVNLAGAGGGNGDSIATDFSRYGRQALFESSASDLVANDTNDCSDVFWRDMTGGTTRLVSAGANGGAANGPSRESVMTSDGRYVAFVSEANNLVSGDTNGIADVFVMDTQSNRMTLVSVGAMSTNSTAPSGASSDPDITSDGRFVAFYSTATNLVPGVRPGGDVYVRDLVAGVTYWASADARAALAAVMGAAETNNAVVSHPMISRDGVYVVFRISPGIASAKATSGLILRYNLDFDFTEVVHTNAHVVAGTASDEMRCLDMTPDGEFIAFMANTSISSADAGKTSCIRVWNGLTGETLLASGNLNNAVPSGSTVGWPSIDPTGRFVAFMSPMTNMPYNPVFVTNALSKGYHLYVRDLQAGTTKLVDAEPYSLRGSGVSSWALSRLVAGGQYIAFQAPDGNLVPNDSNQADDVFLRDLVTGTTRLISARAPTLPSLSPKGSTVGWPLSASTDGRYVAFTSEADNLVPEDTNKCQDVFVRDVAAGVNYLVSACSNSITPGENASVEPSISADGRYVAFTSYATNLVAGDSNGKRDVFVRDLLAGTTTLVSVHTNLPGSGNGDSYTPVISADGQRVLFRSTAKDLAPGVYLYTGENLFYRELPSGTTRALTTTTTSGSPAPPGVYSAAMTPDGRWVAFVGTVATLGAAPALYVWDSQSATRVYTNALGASSPVSISADGSRVAYITNSQLHAADWTTGATWQIGPMAPSSRAGLHFSADGRFLTYASTNAQMLVDTNVTYDVYLYDLQTHTKVLVSQRDGFHEAANAASDCPDISPDGRMIAYRSVASNLVPGDNNGAADVFVYERATGKTTLLSVSMLASGPADSWSFPPLFTGDGSQVIFQSWASDLVGFDFNHGGDVFAYALFYAPLNIQIAPGGLPDSSPTLSWPARMGKTYRVEFLDALGVGNWQEALGMVTIVDQTAYFTDLMPSDTRRFYRVVAN